MLDNYKDKQFEAVHEQGIQESLEQRRNETIKLNIINMLKKQFDVNLISKVTGKSIDYINTIAKKIK